MRIGFASLVAAMAPLVAGCSGCRDAPAPPKVDAGARDERPSARALRLVATGDGEISVASVSGRVVVTSTRRVLEASPDGSLVPLPELPDPFVEGVHVEGGAWPAVRLSVDVGHGPFDAPAPRRGRTTRVSMAREGAAWKKTEEHLYKSGYASFRGGEVHLEYKDYKQNVVASAGPPLPPLPEGFTPNVLAASGDVLVATGSYVDPKADGDRPAESRAWIVRPSGALFAKAPVEDAYLHPISGGGEVYVTLPHVERGGLSVYRLRGDELVSVPLPAVPRRPGSYFGGRAMVAVASDGALWAATAVEEGVFVWRMDPATSLWTSISPEPIADSTYMRAQRPHYAHRRPPYYAQSFGSLGVVVEEGEHPEAGARPDLVAFAVGGADQPWLVLRAGRHYLFGYSVERPVLDLPTPGDDIARALAASDDAPRPVSAECFGYFLTLAGPDAGATEVEAAVARARPRLAAGQVLVQGRVRGRPVLGIWVGAAPFEGVEALARELAQNPATEPSISCTPPELDRGYPAAADAGPPPFPVVEPSGF